MTDVFGPPFTFAEPAAPPPPLPPPSPPPRRRMPAGAVVALVLLAAVVGAVAGNVVQSTRSASTATAPAGTVPASRTNSAVSPPTSTPSTASSATSAIVAKVDPAVVDITTTLDGGEAAGTGMVLTSSGLVLTNNHVIDGATTIAVQIAGKGAQHAARVVGYDATHDVALVQIEDVSDLATVSIGDTSSLSVGDAVVTIGNARGAAGPHAVSTGSIDALDQTITANDLTGGAEQLEGLIQIDAGLQPGDSGGPLVSSSGQVIGMNTAASARTRRGSAASVGFAIPIDAALKIADQIRTGQSSGTIHVGDRGVLGVQVADAGDGIGVVGVQSGSPADDAGLARGDTITAIDGTRVTSIDELHTALDDTKPGDKASVTWTDASGSTHTKSITLVAGPPP